MTLISEIRICFEKIKNDEKKFFWTLFHNILYLGGKNVGNIVCSLLLSKCKSFKKQ